MVLAKYGVKEAQNRRNACFDWFREGDCKKIESLGEGRRSCVTGDGRGIGIEKGNTDSLLCTL